MPRYEQNGLSFELPQNWSDRTIVAFSTPSLGPEQPRASVVMARHPFTRSDGLDEHAAREVRGMLERAGNGRVLDRAKRTLRGRLAVETRMTWIEPEGPIELTMVHVEPGPGEHDPRVIVFTFATAPGASRAALEELLATIRFAETPPAPAFDLVPMPGVPRAREH